MFSKRHYESIAKVFRDSQVGKIPLLYAFADMFDKDNQLFNKQRFLKACE